MTADENHRTSYNRYTRRGLVVKVGLRAHELVLYYYIQTRNVHLAKYRYKKEHAPPLERSACSPLEGRRHIKRMSGCQIKRTRPLPRRLTHAVAPSPVRWTDASARSRWKRSRSVRVARGLSGPRPPAAPAGPRQTHASHVIACGGGGEVHHPAATPDP